MTDSVWCAQCGKAVPSTIDSAKHCGGENVHVEPDRPITVGLEPWQSGATQTLHLQPGGPIPSFAPPPYSPLDVRPPRGA